MSRLTAAGLALALVACAAGPVAAQGADPEAAERQYRVARRLAADGSAEAATALRKVLELDPSGPRADDALVDLALLRPLAGWPEDLGRLGATDAKDALALLDQALGDPAAGDRAASARYLRALLRLEPLAMHDPSKARVDLLAVATAVPAAAESDRARYALAWLREQQGDDKRALDAYERLTIDDPAGPGAARARVGAARVLIRAGEHAAAASRLQQAVEAGVDEATLARPLRELAVRVVLGGPAAAGRSDRFAADLRGVGALAPAPDGGVFLASRREGRVLHVGPDGRTVAAWGLDSLHALAVDPRGRPYVAAGAGIYRLEARGQVARVASLGEFAPAGALAVDGLGGFWVVDRRGQRIGRIAPGAATPQPFWEDRTFRLESAVWDGRRLVAIEQRSRSLVAIGPDARPVSLVGAGLIRPAALAADPGGVVAVLDTRSGFVSFVTPDGTAREAFAFATSGVEAPVAIALDWEGRLHLFDESDGTWNRRP